MIITLTGNNSFALHQRLNGLVGEFIKKYGDLALELIDAEEAEAQAVLGAVQSPPFLAERKMVVVRNLSSNKQASELIEQIISSAGDSTDLIFYDSVTDKRTAYYKILKAKTKLEQFNELDAQSLANWLVEEAKNGNASLSLSEARFLVERVGTNQSLLANELQKLLTYDPKITHGTIELLTEPNPQSKVFELLDAAFSGNKKNALRLYEEQRAQKVEPQAILAMIAWQLQILAVAKYGSGKPANAIAKDSGLSPYPVTKAQGLARKINEDKLKNMVAEAFEIDWRSKTSAIDLDEALKTYITTL
jgi:DNA polymerase-3 subunit delta